jgi:hypothetical protein
MALRADIGTLGDALMSGRSFGTFLVWPAEPFATTGLCTSSQDIDNRSAFPFPFSKNDVSDAPPLVASTSNSASTKVLSTAGKVANISSIIFLLSWMAFCILDVVPGIIDAANRRSSLMAEAYWPLWTRRTQTRSCIIGTEDGGSVGGGWRAYLWMRVCSKFENGNPRS